MDNNTSFAKEIAKASLASGAISAASTAGFFGGLLAVGVVIQKIADRKKK
jgi:hypothetical protein